MAVEDNNKDGVEMSVKAEDSNWLFLMECLVGKNIEAKISAAPDIVTGVLLSFDEFGEIVVQDSDGDIHYCWPCLEISEVIEQ